jgi:hypothetical protein
MQDGACAGDVAGSQEVRDQLRKHEALQQTQRQSKRLLGLRLNGAWSSMLNYLIPLHSATASSKAGLPVQTRVALNVSFPQSDG